MAAAGPEGGGIGGWRVARYLLVVALSAVATVLVPIPYRHIWIVATQTQARPTYSAEGRVALFGSSTIDSASRCEGDKRSIAAMVAAASGRPVMDVSYGNQTVEEAANLADLAVRLTRMDTVVLATGWLELAESANLAFHDYVAFRLLNPGLRAEGVLAYFRHHVTPFTRPLNSYSPFEYRGRPYPGLDGFETTVFRAEHDRFACPEVDGRDASAVEALYYHRMVEFAPAEENARLIASLQAALKGSGRRMVFVLLPINFEVLGRYDAAWPGLLRERRDAFLGQLRAGGVPIVDLTEGVSNAGFIDRWCGCTHYGAEARAMIGARIADALR